MFTEESKEQADMGRIDTDNSEFDTVKKKKMSTTFLKYLKNNKRVIIANISNKIN